MKSDRLALFSPRDLLKRKVPDDARWEDHESAISNRESRGIRNKGAFGWFVTKFQRIPYDVSDEVFLSEFQNNDGDRLSKERGGKNIYL